MKWRNKRNLDVMMLFGVGLDQDLDYYWGLGLGMIGVSLWVTGMQFGLRVSRV